MPRALLQTPDAGPQNNGPLILSVLHFCIGEASVTFLFIEYTAQMRLRQRLGYGKDHHIARTGNAVAVEFGKGGEQTFTGFL